MQTEVMTTILERLLEHLKNGESTDFSLGALSRFAVAVNLNPQLNESFVGQSIMRQVLFYIDRVTTSNELRLLAICLNNLRSLLSKDTIGLVEKKVYQFIEEGKLKDDQWAILKILQFLCFPYWSQGSFPLIRALLLELQEKIPTFNTRELEYVGMLCQVNFEPASVITTIAARALELLKNNPSPEMLPSTVFYSSPANRKHLTKLAKNYLISDPNPDAAALKSLFKALRLLKISDITVCNDYWSKVNNFIMSNPSQQKFHMITKYCHRYMHFNNNLNGTYKNYPLEKTLVKLLVKDLDEGISAVIPSRFSKAASFILAYGHTPDKYTFPEYIVQKIEAMQEQFTVVDCLTLTRGIQVALQMRFNRERSPALIQQIVRMENVFNACTDRHLDQPNLSLSDLNSVIRSYSSRKSEMKASIYRKMIEKYETIHHEPLNSRIIRDITFNLNVAKYSVPTLCNSINEYVIKNREFVLGDTVQKVLYCFYNLNYYPKDETIFECATESINRDFDILSGLAVVEGCLALSFYKELPGPLIDRVFNISFIQRLEDEIEQCYSKDFYPQRVLNSVMQLNRAVCLDYPENGVPWFQQNYIEAQLSNLPTTRNKFHRDVKQVLIEYVTDEKLLKIDHITPYGYRIDFVLYIDANKTVMIPPKLNDPVLHVDKVAILLLDTDTLCQNDFQNVRGKQVLKERHLEMMGFKVVQINYIQWNSMYMSLPGAKSDYVKGLLS
ncbi:FAST kinase domain-containing protein 1, mitochondrial isoform X2 [Bradysia coprophila]|nr:FAST kinase domain-containing protein 1, mitochondrial isoform X2 [Bradysia coprophila]